MEFSIQCFFHMFNWISFPWKIFFSKWKRNFLSQNIFIIDNQPFFKKEMLFFRYLFRCKLQSGKLSSYKFEWKNHKWHFAHKKYRDSFVWNFRIHLILKLKMLMMQATSVFINLATLFIITDGKKFNTEDSHFLSILKKFWVEIKWMISKLGEEITNLVDS